MNLHVSHPPLFVNIFVVVNFMDLLFKKLVVLLLCSVCAEETCAAASEAD